MANLGKKGDVYVARFRYAGKEYKKSLKTTRRTDAEAAMHAVERAIHGLTTGLLQVPPGVDPGDFILSGGTLKQPVGRRIRTLSLTALIDDYLAHQSHKASSTSYTEGVHLRNLKRKLGARADAPADRIAHRELESYLQARLRERKPSTVDKERTTIIGLFRWAVAHGHIETSTAVGLSPIQGEVDHPPFRTVDELVRIRPRLAPALAFIAGGPDAPLAGSWPMRLPGVERAFLAALEVVSKAVPLVAPPLHAAITSGWAYPIGRRLGLLRARAPREDIEQFMRGLAQMDPLAYWHTLRGLSSASASDVLPKVQVPTLIVLAQHDWFVSARKRARLREGLPSAQVVEIADAGHAGLLEAGPEIAAALRAFFEESREAASG